MYMCIICMQVATTTYKIEKCGCATITFQCMLELIFVNANAFTFTIAYIYYYYSMLLHNIVLVKIILIELNSV